MTEQEYLDSILRDIALRKEKGRRSIFKVNEKISDKTAHFVEKYFLDRPQEYTIEIRKCVSCKGTWDIIINFKISNPI